MAKFLAAGAVRDSVKRAAAPAAFWHVTGPWNMVELKNKHARIDLEDEGKGQRAAEVGAPCGGYRYAEKTSENRPSLLGEWIVRRRLGWIRQVSEIRILRKGRRWSGVCGNLVLTGYRY